MATEAAPRSAVLDRVPAVPLLVAGALLLVVVVRVLIADRIVTPWIMVDEIVYSELAKSIAGSGDLSIREHASNVPSVLYPAAIAPGWLFDRVGTAYGVAKAINVLLMTSTIVPVWLWARRLVSPLLATLTVVLVLVMPSMLYTGVLMTENAFLPLFVAACFCLALTLERPTLGHQALVLGFCLLAIGVRLQGVVLLAIVPAAVALKLLFDRVAPGGTWREAYRAARPLWPMFAVLAAGAVAFVAYEEARGQSLYSALGSYQAVGNVSYSFDAVRHWVVLHAAELSFSVGIVPACAFIVLLGLALLGRTETTAERSFVAVTTAALVLVVVQVAAFASRFSLRIEERYLFPLAPLLFIALALWIGRGLPRRPRVLAVVAALLPLVLLLDVHLKNLLGQQILSDTFALIPVWRVTSLVDGGTDTAQALLWLGAAAAAVAFLLLPRRLALLLPAAVAVFLAVGSYPVFGAVRDYARSLQQYAGGGNLEWIDSQVGYHADVPYLYDASKVPGYDDMLLWQTEFWNRSVGAVVALGPHGRDPLVEDGGTIDQATGRIVAPDAAGARYAVVTPGLSLAGEALATRGQLTLYRVDPPLRIASAVEGVYGDGWMGDRAAYNVYGGSPRRVKVVLSRAAWGGKDVPGHVVVQVGPSAVVSGGAIISRTTAVRRLTLHKLQTKTVTLPAPRAPFRVEVTIDPTFSPSQFGLTDTRQLGAQVQFSTT